jgi:hypothetical protein
MNLLNLSNTAIDLNAQKAPFQPNNTVLLIAAAAVTVQESDDEAFTSPVTLGAVTVAGVFQKVTLSKQYVRVSTVADAQLIGN